MRSAGQILTNLLLIRQNTIAVTFKIEEAIALEIRLVQSSANHRILFTYHSVLDMSVSQ